MKEMPLSGIKSIEEVIRSGNDFISLSQGAMRIGGIPLQIKQHVATLMATDLTDYYGNSTGLLALREKIREILTLRHGATFALENILPTHGCVGGLTLVYHALLSPGDEVIIPEPFYPAYELLCRATQTVPVFVSCMKSHNDDSFSWEFDLEKIKKSVTQRTKLIIFSNPTNPTGMVIPLSVIKELLAWCEHRGIYLLVDEAYQDFIFDNSFQSAAPLALTSPFLIQANSFSKNMAMSGWRVGYLIVHTSLLSSLVGMQDAMLNCLNNIAQYAALYALDHPEFLDYFRAVILQNREYLVHALQPLVEHNKFSFITPNAGFFYF